MKTQPVVYQTEVIDGLKIFYREAGPKDAPTILPLHGFPSSSHMFRDLISDLKDKYHLIAPDYPGFGESDTPSVEKFDYRFDRLAEVIEKFIKAKKIGPFFIYMQDYGSPVGFRIAARHPDWIAGLLIQNANAYTEGVGEALSNAVVPFWKNRNAQTEAPLRRLMTLEGTKSQYLTGVSHPERVSPDAWERDQAGLDRPGNKEIQLALLYDYQNNVPRFAEWQRYFREHQPPTLITWGKNDPFFIEPGARAYLRDLPKAELHLLDSGHFALEDQHEEIAARIDTFIQKAESARARRAG